MGYSYQSREEKLLDVKYEHDDDEDFDEADTCTEEDAADYAYNDERDRD